jgi:hypothetical protein
MIKSYETKVIRKLNKEKLSPLWGSPRIGVREIVTQYRRKENCRKEIVNIKCLNL